MASKPGVWQRQAVQMADALGVNVIVGVRPGGKWFAHCDGVEFDGTVPEVAVAQVLAALRRRESEARDKAERDERAADRRAKALIEASYVKAGD